MVMSGCFKVDEFLAKDIWSSRYGRGEKQGETLFRVVSSYQVNNSLDL